MIRAAMFALIASLTPAWSNDVNCSDVTHDGNSYTICPVELSKHELRLFWKDPAGSLFGHFKRVEDQLAGLNKVLSFAMNAGMYHANRAPVGHYVEDGKAETPVISQAGPGNFGLLPNGVFCIQSGRVDVFETLTFLNATPPCDHATQSGPMLVIDGDLHPRFLKDSTSRFLRNGVGTSADGQTAIFAISRNPVTFHEFGRLFRDYLSVPNALYFDGNISRLHAPSLNRSDAGFPMGPIIGVVGSK